MFHVNTEELLDYWRARTSPGLSPSRTLIDPADFARLLPQVFILGREEPGRYVFRLAGELIVDLHANALRGADIMSLWAAQDRLRLASALETSRRRAEPFVALTEARSTGGMEAPLEVLFAPLRSPAGEPNRVIGLYQPRALLARLSGQPVQRLSIRRLVAAHATTAEPALRLAAVDGRRIA